MPETDLIVMNLTPPHFSILDDLFKQRETRLLEV
jgi:hypothetical protein